MSERFRHLTAIALLACAVTLACGEAGAQARGSSWRATKSSSPAPGGSDHNQKLAELDAFLRRLTGRFHYDGIAEDPGDYCYVPRKSRNGRQICVPAIREPATGKSDCVGIGEGPGTHCVVNVTWPDFTDPMRRLPGPERSWIPPLPPALAPSLVLYGIEPRNPGLRFLQIDSKSIAEAALGSLKGDTATFRTDCANEVSLCKRIIRIEAPPDGRLIRVWIDIESMPGVDGYHRVAGLALSLRRVAADVEDSAPNAQRLPGTTTDLDPGTRFIANE